MLRRTGSPLAVVNALALTTATLLTGAWDLSGHGHDVIATNAAYCVVDHEAETSGIAGGTTLGQAAAPHDHSVVVWPPGRKSGARSWRLRGSTGLARPKAR